jgi:oligosaccharide repeat unit polymerase
MFTFLIIFLSALVVCLSAYLFRLSSGSLSLTNLNMMSFLFWVDLLGVSYIGSVIILLFQNTEFNDLVDNLLGGYETKLKVWIFISYTMLAFPIGMWLAKLLWNYKVGEFGRYRQKAIIPLFSPRDSYIRLPLYVLSVLSLAAVVYTYILIGFIPFLKASQLNETEVMQLRSSVDIHFGGNVYFKNVFGMILTPVLTYVSFAYYRVTRSRKDLFWFLLMLAATFFMLTYDLSKSPFVRFLCGFVFFRILTGRVKAGRILWYGAIGIILLVISFVAFGRISGSGNLLFSYNTGISGRVLISQVSSLYRHLEIFPADHPFIGFSSMSQVIPFLHPSERSPRIVMEIVSPSWIESDMGGMYNTLFIGEAYGNFGLAGIILSPLWVGFLIQSFFVCLVRAKKAPLWLGVFTYFSYNSSLTGGINEYIYNARVLILAVIIGLAYLAALYLKRSKELQHNGSRLQGAHTPGLL